MAIRMTRKLAKQVVANILERSPLSVEVKELTDQLAVVGDRIYCEQLTPEQMVFIETMPANWFCQTQELRIRFAAQPGGIRFWRSASARRGAARVPTAMWLPNTAQPSSSIWGSS